MDNKVELKDMSILEFNTDVITDEMHLQEGDIWVVEDKFFSDSGFSMHSGTFIKDETYKRYRTYDEFFYARSLNG